MDDSNDNSYIEHDLVVNECIGLPLPPDYHAVSVALPTWLSVVGYEEGHAAVVNSMKIGYPRFRFHNQVAMLIMLLRVQRFFELQQSSALMNSEQVEAVVVDAPGEAWDGVTPALRRDALLSQGTRAILLSDIAFDCLALPNKAVAQRLEKFLLHGLPTCDCVDATGQPLVAAYSIGRLPYAAVFFPSQWAAKAKSFWQHCGELISSRHAIQAVQHLQQQLLADYLSFDWWQLPAVNELLDRVCVISNSSSSSCRSSDGGNDKAAAQSDGCISETVAQAQIPRLLQQLCTTSRVVRLITPQQQQQKSFCRFFSGDALTAELAAAAATNTAAVPAVVAAVPSSKKTLADAHIVVISRIASVLQEPAHFLTNSSSINSSNDGGNDGDCDIAGCCSNIALTVSGMAAIFTALRLSLQLHAARAAAAALEVVDPPPAKIVVFGFPYLDTLKMMRREELNPGGCLFFGRGDAADLDALEAALKAGVIPSRSQQNQLQQQQQQQQQYGQVALNEIAAVFTEFPSNPLMRCPDLLRLTSLAREFGFLLVVDDTIANFANCDLLHSPDVCVDILVSSLTKVFDGRGNVLAGSVVINSLGAASTALQQQLTALQRTGDLPRICSEDGVILERNSRSFLQRSQRSNINAAALATHLSQHPAVATVYYPHIGTSVATAATLASAKTAAVEEGLSQSGSAPAASEAERIFRAVHRRNELCYTLSDNPWQLDCEMEKQLVKSWSRAGSLPSAAAVAVEAAATTTAVTATVEQVAAAVVASDQCVLPAPDSAASEVIRDEDYGIGTDFTTASTTAPLVPALSVPTTLDSTGLDNSNSNNSSNGISSSGTSSSSSGRGFLLRESPSETRLQQLTHNRSIGDLAARMETHRPGFGCLLSIVLKPHASTKVFYDSLRVNKGPSLGTNFTLVCPYTLLAHYNELAWAAAYGVDAALIRISAGVERTQDLIRIFDDALSAAVAHGPDAVTTAATAFATDEFA